MFTTFDPEFGKDPRKTAVIVRAIHGLTLAGAAFRSHLARCIESLGLKSCKVGPDLWPKPEIRPENGVQNYSYHLCYVDGILYIHHNTDTVSQQLHKSFPLKLGLGKPDM